jgi:PiT family inorganic phosphate transporter
MPDHPALLVAVVVTALFFDFTNGLNDSANAIATVISTRVLSPRKAIAMAAVLNFAGAFFTTAVATTIGKDIVAAHDVTQFVVLSAVVAAALWNLAATSAGMPISASHALVGGLVGAVIADKGPSVLNAAGLTKIFTALLISPIFGFIGGFTLMVILFRIFHSSAPAKLNRVFGKLQILSASFMAFSHGSNDAQKSMGIITLALVSGGALGTFKVPVWVMAACASVIALGTAVGGWKVIKTLGVKIHHMQPIHGFAAETTASMVILAASHMGAPVSTTHVISSCIVGVGASKRLSAVRWGIARHIVLAWILTLPVTAGAGWCLSTLLHALMR